jgi:ANTAR domain/GAF domain
LALLNRRGADPSATDAGEESALIDTVVALRDELQGLRTAGQLRAIIEQAKGVLVERHHITLDEAFGRLRAMSQQHNVRLVEVAATVVGVALPPGAASVPDPLEQVVRGRLPASTAASPTWRLLAQQPDVRTGIVTALIDSVAGAPSQGDEAAQLLSDLLTAYEVCAVTLYSSVADGSLRLLGQAGVPGDLISSWQSIPPSRDIPYVRSMTEDQPFFWDDRAVRSEQFPAVASANSTFEAAATIPIHDAGAVVGVVGLMWDTRQSFDDERRSAIVALVQQVAHLLMRNASQTDPELEWLHVVLSLHLDPWLLLEAKPASDGVVRDFVVQSASAQVVRPGGLVGRHRMELWPSAAASGMGQALTELARTGGSWTLTVGFTSDCPWGTPGSRVRAVRLGRRVVLVWRPGTT